MFSFVYLSISKHKSLSVNQIMMEVSFDDSFNLINLI